MGAKRRRVGAASATVSAGAVAFFAFGTGPAAAQTRSAQAGADCKLGTLLCGILGGAGGAPSTPPATGGSSTAPKPKTTAQPKPATRPKPAPAPARHSGSTGGAAGPAVRPPSGPGGNGPAVPVPLDRPTPVLPDVTAQDPVVFPEPSPGGRPAPARLVAAGDEQSPSGTIPPLLVATASGLAGAVAALNMSMLKRRRRTH